MALTAHLSTSSPKLVSGLGLASIWVLFASIAWELRHRLLCYSQPTWPPFHWKCGFKSLLIQHLQPSESFFRSCGSPTRNNNLFTTIGAEKTKRVCFQSCPLCAPWICAGLLLIAPFRSLVAFVVPMELRFFHGDTFDPWRYVFIHRRRQTCSWCYARHSYARDFPIRDWSVAVSAFTTLALAVFSLFHGFCFVPWVLPCYRPEKERFSSQELSFPIILLERVFEKSPD